MAKPTANNRDAIAFAQNVFGVHLWSRQQDILRAIESNRRVAVKACHSSGKTMVAAIAALWFAVRHKHARTLILAPGWLTVRAVVWSEIHSLLARARLRLPTSTLNQTEIRLGPDNLILGLSSNDSTRIQGHHSEHMLIVADESVGIDATFWPAIEGVLASGDSHLLLLGNPTVSSGYFYDAFTRRSNAWKTFTIDAFSTPNLEGLSLEQLLKLSDHELDGNPAPYLTTRRWVRERHGEWFNGSADNSPLWQSRVLGEFPSSGSNALIPLYLLEAAQREPLDDGSPIIIGVDPAGPGKDKTAVVATAGGAIVACATFSDADSVGPVLAFIRQFDSKLKIVRVDSAGMGFHFCERIRAFGYPCEGINVAKSASENEKERFSNSKAARYWHLRQRFQKGEISGLTGDMLAELAAITWLVDSAGRTAIEGKVEVKSMLGHSPDLAEALMLALGTAPFVMEYRSVADWRRRQQGTERKRDGDLPEAAWAPGLGRLVKSRRFIDSGW